MTYVSNLNWLIARKISGRKGGIIHMDGNNFDSKLEPFPAFLHSTFISLTASAISYCLLFATFTICVHPWPDLLTRGQQTY